MSRPERFGRGFAAAAMSAVWILAASPGCGGDESSAPPTTTPTSEAGPTATATETAAAGPTHEEFVTELDSICERGNRQAAAQQAEYQQAVDANDLPRAGELLATSLAKNETYADELDDLVVPPEDEAAFARYNLERERVQSLSERIATALKASDTQEVLRLSNLADTARDRRTEAAVDLGTTHCGS